MKGIAVGDDDDVGTSRVLPDDVLDIDLVQRSGLRHAGERDQREQRVVIARASVVLEWSFPASAMPVGETSVSSVSSLPEPPWCLSGASLPRPCL